MLSDQQEPQSHMMSLRLKDLRWKEFSKSDRCPWIQDIDPSAPVDPPTLILSSDDIPTTDRVASSSL